MLAPVDIAKSLALDDDPVVAGNVSGWLNVFLSSSVNKEIKEAMEKGNKTVTITRVDVGGGHESMPQEVFEYMQKLVIPFGYRIPSYRFDEEEDIFSLTFEWD